MGVRGKMLFCGNKFLLTITNKKEVVYELEFTMIIEDGPRQGSADCHDSKFDRDGPCNPELGYLKLFPILLKSTD